MLTMYRADEFLCQILYRSGDSVKLNATSFDYVTDMFLQPDGSILTDHNAVLAEFSWSSV